MHTINKNNTSYCSKDNKVKACAEKKKRSNMLEAQITSKLRPHAPSACKRNQDSHSKGLCHSTNA